MLGKTQHEVESEYFFVDLPELLMLKDQIRASELLENIDVAAFPHTDKKGRETIVKRFTSVLPKPPEEAPKSAEEQYQALKMRMKGR